MLTGTSYPQLKKFTLLTVSRNQWSGMFGSRSTNVGSQLPLWAVQFDSKPGVNTVTTFMGGWTSAVAKQYNLGEPK